MQEKRNSEKKLGNMAKRFISNFQEQDIFILLL